jgi:hypothetical protein
MVKTWENFHCATLELVRSSPIKQRLACAYRRHLAGLSEEQLPGELREPFCQVRRSLSGVPPLRGEDAIAASVRKMSNHDADECAALIVEIFWSICRAQAATPRVANPLPKLHSVAGHETADDSGEFEAPAWIANH